MRLHFPSQLSRPFLKHKIAACLIFFLIWGTIAAGLAWLAYIQPPLPILVLTGIFLLSQIGHLISDLRDLMAIMRR